MEQQAKDVTASTKDQPARRYPVRVRSTFIRLMRQNRGAVA